MEAEVHNLLADHTIDVCLRGELVRDVIEHKQFLLVLGFHHKLIFAVREVDAAGEARLWIVGLQPDHHLHLLFTVQPAGTRLHRYIKPVR